MDYAKDGELLRPRFSSRIYSGATVEQTFVLLLLIVCIGEFLSGPAVSLVDGVTLELVKVSRVCRNVI